MGRKRRPRWVSVAKTAEEIDPEGEGPWITVCERHGYLCTHATKAVAVSWARDPGEWCEPCYDAEAAAR